MTAAKYTSSRAAGLANMLTARAQGLGLPPVDWEGTPSPSGKMILMGVTSAPDMASGKSIADAYVRAGIITETYDGPATTSSLQDPEPGEDELGTTPPNAWVVSGQGFADTSHGTAMIMMQVVIAGWG